jgi:hypothetical protein
MNLPFVRDRRPTEQHIVFVEEGDLYRPLSQRKSGAAALQAAPQDSNTHSMLCEIFVLVSRLLTRSPKRERFNAFVREELAANAALAKAAGITRQ